MAEWVDGMLIGSSGFPNSGSVFPDSERHMAVKSSKNPTPVRQADRRGRLLQILERDGQVCVWCGTPFDERFTKPTTEHLVPRIKGGPSWLENEMAACRRCNKARGHQTVGAWLDECASRGWTPNTERVVAQLEELLSSIEARGGQRRARRYAESQLRRVRRLQE